MIAIIISMKLLALVGSVCDFEELNSALIISNGESKDDIILKCEGDENDEYLWEAHCEDSAWEITRNGTVLEGTIGEYCQSQFPGCALSNMEEWLVFPNPLKRLSIKPEETIEVFCKTDMNQRYPLAIKCELFDYKFVYLKNNSALSIEQSHSDCQNYATGCNLNDLSLSAILIGRIVDPIDKRNFVPRNTNVTINCIGLSGAKAQTAACEFQRWDYYTSSGEKIDEAYDSFCSNAIKGISEKSCGREDIPSFVRIGETPKEEYLDSERLTVYCMDHFDSKEMSFRAHCDAGQWTFFNERSELVELEQHCANNSMCDMPEISPRDWRSLITNNTCASEIVAGSCHFETAPGYVASSDYGAPTSFVSIACVQPQVANVSYVALSPKTCTSIVHGIQFVRVKERCAKISLSEGSEGTITFTARCRIRGKGGKLIKDRNEKTYGKLNIDCDEFDAFSEISVVSGENPFQTLLSYLPYIIVMGLAVSSLLIWLYAKRKYKERILEY